jgi:hypothetical protein
VEGKKLCSKLCIFFSVQVCLNPWTVQRQVDLRMYLFWGGKGMFLCFYVKKLCLWTCSKARSVTKKLAWYDTIFRYGFKAGGQIIQYLKNAFVTEKRKRWIGQAPRTKILELYQSKTIYVSTNTM